MAIETPNENWTKFPNCILDNLEKFTPAEFKVLGLMVRKNLGYENPTKQFSLTYIKNKTGLSKQTVVTSVKGLIEKDAIKEIGQGKQGIKIYEISWDGELVQKLDRSKILTSQKNELVQKLDRNRSKILTDTSPKIRPSIRNNIKKTSKENNTTSPPIRTIPEKVDPDTWDAFLESRSKLKAPNTDRAINLIISKLKSLDSDGHNPQEVVENSVMNGWKGVFPLKNFGNKRPNNHPYAEHPAVKAGILNPAGAKSADNITRWMERKQKEMEEKYEKTD